MKESYKSIIYSSMKDKAISYELSKERMNMDKGYYTDYACPYCGRLVSMNDYEDIKNDPYTHRNCLCGYKFYYYYTLGAGDIAWGNIKFEPKNKSENEPKSKPIYMKDKDCKKIGKEILESLLDKKLSIKHMQKILSYLDKRVQGITNKVLGKHIVEEKDLNQ